MLTALGYFYLTATIYNLAHQNVLTTAIINMVLIFVFVIFDKLLAILHIRMNKNRDKTKPLSLLKKFFNWYLDSASFKSTLYLFYIAITIGLAINAAGAQLRFFTQGYLIAMQYGLLLLFAVDKFLSRIFKDIVENEECINGGVITDVENTSIDENKIENQNDSQDE